MRTLLFTLAYEGTGYVGWQRQAASAGVSVQGLVEEAHAQFAGHASVAAAGRTDAGVHALGQAATVVSHAPQPVDVIRRAMNAVLPHDVRVLDVEERPPGFHARYHARGKSYRYCVDPSPVQLPFQRRYAWHLPHPFDLEAMRDAASRFAGTHDFASLQAAGSDVIGTVRTLTRVEVLTQRDGTLAIEVDGDGFLRHMVRAIAGTLIDVGHGRRPASSIDALLASRDRSQAGRTAPAHGLFLVSVRF
ncbi:MAG: tRNA pseudouridine(38-40) synthase TruA [Acidobacteriota bacterium]|nr:tRNA pseudouridine(38-40) synthase TruA [Acidobacteriota bacterium]